MLYEWESNMRTAISNAHKWPKEYCKLLEMQPINSFPYNLRSTEYKFQTQFYNQDFANKVSVLILEMLRSHDYPSYQLTNFDLNPNDFELVDNVYSNPLPSDFGSLN